MRRGPSTYCPHWAERVARAPPGGVWVGGWFSSQLYYPFSKGPGQHIIRCLKNKKCENERTKGTEKRGGRRREARIVKSKIAVTLVYETGAVFVVLAKRMKKKKEKRGERTGEGEGKRLES